ncbi:TetR/AcrR family transcriptional regulator [Prolixibacteraceae bacterium JC049]|nr:TetR/AcrR family transcriptional regulator [Prolixibacteraceae bacterium JC049]
MGTAERKEREKQRRRTTIINAAERIFFSSRGNKKTMDDVAKRVELSKGTLYLYFKNKDELLYAIAQKGVNKLCDYLKQSTSTTLNGREQLSEYGDAFVQFVTDHPKHFDLILRFEILEPTIESDMIMEPALNLLQHALTLGQSDGTIRKDHTEKELVIVLWSQMVGILNTIKHKEKYLNQFNIDVQQIIKGHFHLIMQGIG